MTLDAATGGLTLRWKTRNPPNARRTTYIIRRKLPGETQFQFVGTTGTKRFVDNTLVVGARARERILAPATTPAASRAGGTLAPPMEAVQYTIQGQRANLSGPVSPIFNVNFGKEASKSKGESRKSRIETRQSKGES